MSGEVPGVSSDTIVSAGSTSSTASGATVRVIGVPVAAQREATRAVLPIKTGNIKVSSAHQVYKRRPSTSKT